MDLWQSSERVWRLRLRLRLLILCLLLLWMQTQEAGVIRFSSPLVLHLTHIITPPSRGWGKKKQKTSRRVNENRRGCEKQTSEKTDAFRQSVFVCSGCLESIYLSGTPHCSSECQTVTLPGLRTACATCQGLPWATDRAPLRVETGFGDGSAGFRRTNRLPQYSSSCTAEPQFVCTSPHLRLTCLNPDEDGERSRRRREGIFSSQSVSEQILPPLCSPREEKKIAVFCSCNVIIQEP